MSFVISAPFPPDSYEQILRDCGGDAAAVFVGLGSEITRRYFTQVEVPPPGDAFVEHLWRATWEIIHREQLPQPLAARDIGEPRRLGDDYLFTLTDQILAQLPRHRAEDTLRALCVQILVGLLSPEFRACRQSYQTVGPDGKCARLEIAHCRDRVSGAHCEDCPFFVALSAAQHGKLLARAYAMMGGAAPFRPDLFLPEDFRALRVFWHLHLRQVHR